MSNTELTAIPVDLLARCHGGMRYTDSDRMSDNVEDRRTPEGRAANQKWWEDNKGDYNTGGGKLDPIQPPTSPQPSGGDFLPGPPGE